MDLDNLKRRIELVERDSKVSPALLAHFADWVRSATDDELFKVDVLMWAEAHQIPQDEALDLFLHAARAGIFEMSWGVICPFCGMLVTTPGGLKALGPNPHCRLCRVQFPASADDQIEVTFSLEPGIRKLRYYEPDQIDPKRDAVRLFFSPAFEPIEHREEMQRGVKGAKGMAPGETTTFEVTLPEGIAVVLVPNVHAVCFLHVHAGGRTEASVEVQDGATLPGEMGIGADVPVRITVNNRSNYHVYAMVMNFEGHEDPPDPEHAPPIVIMRPFLTGKRVLTNQTFRDLFRTETIGEGGLAIKNLAMVFSDLQASTALYERVGDIRALELVRAHFEKLNDVVRRHRGAVVKTIGDAVMAAFGEPDAALAAAAGMTRAVRKIDADGEMLNLKIGVHAGSCIAIQTNHQIDYFGSAVNVAARVQGVAHGGEIVVTDTIWKAPGIQGLVDDFGLEATPDRVDLRGIAQAVQVYRLH
jgi:class 3 adenylate cyclase